MMIKWAFGLILAVRIFNALTIKTFFQLDEYYQALEPLYYLVFHKGILTWEWQHQLRSFIHPLLFTLPYEVCSIFKLGDYWVRLLPKLLQLVLSSVGEYNTFILLLKLTHNYHLALVTLFLSLTSPFNWYFITRSFSNNMEMILTVVALNYFPLRDHMINYRKYVIGISLALISCLIRPTNVFIWICLGIDLLLRALGSQFKILLITIATTVVVVSLNIVVDYIFYQKLTFPLWNFLQFNVFSSLSSFYGVNTLSFYILQAVPVIMTTYLPFLLTGLYQLTKMKNIVLKKLCVISIANIGLFSVISHKEFRFIYPLMPIFMIISSLGYTKLSHSMSKCKWKLILTSILILNLGISYYMTRIHESGVITVTDYLKNEVPQDKSIGFLMPCHSTPYQSYFNMDPSIDIWSLSCEPPLEGQDLSTYMDESDIFYDDPVLFLTKDMSSWPDYIVIFDALPQEAKNYLTDIRHYNEIHRIFNSRGHWDSRREGDVIILAK